MGRVKLGVNPEVLKNKDTNAHFRNKKSQLLPNNANPPLTLNPNPGKIVSPK